VNTHAELFNSMRRSGLEFWTLSRRRVEKHYNGGAIQCELRYKTSEKLDLLGPPMLHYYYGLIRVSPAIVLSLTSNHK
jgi:hypothetical protein